MNDVKSAEIFTPVALENIPHGKYDGVWSGYEVIVIINGAQFRLNTKNGIRTVNAKCSVIVDGNGIEIKVK